ncbi:methyl-accepting chemotaxis sensory transducer [Rhodovulum sulfidophilum]|uniref:Methyl-accepting chemotaxis sensory transducer n=1 Tax=Rhodovulum sulfidophilum TaxID=35806 RepID=A0A0D6B219_RHOSU|nr:methyl-accepting chemotaxis sensory transducer [Rhodovulum sulfidophilum]
MLKFLSTVFGSIALKFSSILVLMGAMTAAAILIATMVFNTLSASLTGLMTDALPGISTSVTVIENTGEIRDSLSEMLMARDIQEVDEGYGDFISKSKDIVAAVNRLPGPEKATFLPMLTALSDEVGQMRAALDRRFARQNRMQEQLTDFSATVEEIRAALAEMTEDAVRDMNIAGERTIESVSDTLETLVHTDFDSTALILQARAEINLLSGVALAIAGQKDPAMIAILRDLAAASLRKLDTVLAELDAAGTIPQYLPILTDTRAAFANVANTGFRARAGYIEDVMKLRDDSNIALSSATDDLTFKLMIGAEETAAFNRDTIHRLLGNEVQQIRDTADIDLAVKTLVATSYLGATARDIADADGAQTQIVDARDRLTELTGHVYLTDTLRGMIDRLAAYADPNTGIVATRRAAILARDEAEAGSRSAYERLREIAGAASAQDNAAMADANAAGAALLADADAARDRLHLVTLGSGAIFILAPVLTWILIIWPMGRLARVTGRLAQGELTKVRGFGIFGGEIARMGAALVVFRDRLVERDRMQRLEREAEQDRQARAAQQNAVVSELAAALQSLSAGDLTARLENRFPEDYERLRTDFNATIDTLNELIGSVVENATEIHSRAEEIAGAAGDLSRRTENQAATLEQTAAALDEMTSSVRSAADGAAKVEDVVREARGNAEQSGLVVREAIGAMAEIKKSSDGINQIIGVIDDIAFQTNLLALNAGVEAARAGEAGRGFAVVASEVRALAQRSSEAAKEIKTLISASSDHVASGVSLVNRGGAALSDIVERVSHIAELIGGIATGAKEQSVGLGEINVGVSELDKATQQNAAMVEETTAASTTLKQEASSLQRLVSRFRLRGVPGAARRTEPAPSPDDTRMPKEPRKPAVNDGGWQDF